jgi:predicted Zn-dependent protease
MLDAGLNRPQDALPYLARAAASMPDDPEVIASYAHALLRTGQPERAELVLRRGLPAGAEGSAVAARRLLERWTKHLSAE